jgi:hypothetical protein
MEYFCSFIYGLIDIFRTLSCLCSIFDTLYVWAQKSQRLCILVSLKWTNTRWTCERLRTDTFGPANLFFCSESPIWGIFLAKNINLKFWHKIRQERHIFALFMTSSTFFERWAVYVAFLTHSMFAFRNLNDYHVYCTCMYFDIAQINETHVELWTGAHQHFWFVYPRKTLLKLWLHAKK